jgi:FkbM family methyltransferase
MSRLDRALGLARSLAIYRAIPFRARRLRRLYAQFVRPGDLVFDIGGHVGNHTRAFVSLGCRVVILEPQPAFAQLLRRAFAQQASVEIVEAAVTDIGGRAELSISERTPTVSTLITSWRDARAQDAGFAAVRWNQRVQVETTTLDRLIDRCGVPAFIKIDVEGAEPHVLAGLRRPVAALSFEYLLGDLDRTRQSVDRLRLLAPYRFNWSVGETSRLASKVWIGGEELHSALSGLDTRRRSGDVYARVMTQRPPSGIFANSAGSAVNR